MGFGLGSSGFQPWLLIGIIGKTIKKKKFAKLDPGSPLKNANLIASNLGLGI